MNHCVRGREGGVIVDDGRGRGVSTVDGLQWLLLTLVICQDHTRAKVHAIKRGGHYSKNGRWDHGCLVDNNEVILIDPVVVSFG